MPVFTTATVLTLAGLAVAAGGAAYSAEQGMEAKDQAKDAAKDQAAKEMKAEAALKAKQAADLAAQGQAAAASTRKMTLLQGGVSDKGGTVKTGPLGLAGSEGNYAKKIALGL